MCCALQGCALCEHLSFQKCPEPEVFLAPRHWKNTVFSSFSTFLAHLDLLSTGSVSSSIFCLLPFSSHERCGQMRDEKLHTVVARSTCRSPNVQDTSASDHCLEVEMSKSARRCGAKHISKSKCSKHHMYGPLLDVQIWFCVAGARDCEPYQKWSKTWGFCSSFKYNHHYTTLQLQLQLPLHLH